jgi:hypothetical protein
MVKVEIDHTMYLSAITLKSEAWYISANDSEEHANLKPFNTFSISTQGAMASLIMGISFGGGVYAWSSPPTIALFVVSGTLWLSFIAQQYFALFTTKERRLFQAKYLHSKEMVILFLQILAASCVVYIPLYCQFVRGDTSLQTAARLLPLVFSQVVGVIMSGALLNKVGYYFPWYLAGGLFSLVGGVLLYLVKLDTSTGAIYGYSVLVGLGSGLYVQIGYAICQLLVPAAEIPHTVAFVGYGHITGITLSLTLGGSIFLNTATNAVQHILPDMPKAIVQKGITGTSGHFFSTLPPADRVPILSAIVGSISDLYMMVIVAASRFILMSLAMKRQRLVTVPTK